VFRQTARSLVIIAMFAMLWFPNPTAANPAESLDPRETIYYTEACYAWFQIQHRWSLFGSAIGGLQPEITGGHYDAYMQTFEQIIFDAARRGGVSDDEIQEIGELAATVVSSRGFLGPAFIDRNVPDYLRDIFVRTPAPHECGDFARAYNPHLEGDEPYLEGDEGAGTSTTGEACARYISSARHDAAATGQVEPTAYEESANYVTVRYGRVPLAFVPPIPDDSWSPRIAALQIRIEEPMPCSLTAINVHRYPLTVLDTSALMRDYSSESTQLISEDISALEESSEILQCLYRGAPSDSSLRQELFWYKAIPELADPNRLRTRVINHPLLIITPRALDNCPATWDRAVAIAAAG